MMSSPRLEEEGVLRQWAPLSKFLQKIPIWTRQGIVLEDVRITCVDATVDCIVIGTNSSTVFWYERASHQVQSLRPEKGSNSITCVKVVSTVDFMVACGDKSGIVSIFKIPKSSGNEKELGTNISEKIERYTVDGLHKTSVTALEWSINGQKLFSGDSDGIVVFTEMDFVMNLSKAKEILNEKYSVVQLSYNQREQILLIASELRCILWRGQNANHTITQIGQRERPSLLALGGTIVCEESGEVTVYSCRGGLKLWKADINGEVKFTLLFKEALKKCKNTVKLLKPLETSENNKKVPEFGKIYYWRDGLFVSYTKDSIVVFDPVQVTVVATLINVKEIVCVCATRSELFFTTGTRDLIRLGFTPDHYDSCIGGYGNMATGECVSGLPEVSVETVYGCPLSTSVSRSSYLSASTANSELSSAEVTYGTDPSVLPPLVSLHNGVPELRVEPSRYQQYNSIGQQEFDDIIYSEKRLSKNKNRRKSAEIIEPKPKSLGLSFDGFATYVNNLGRFFNGEYSSSVCDGELESAVGSGIPKKILPDLRNQRDIVEDVARKEMLLEASLETLIEELKPPLELPKVNGVNSMQELSSDITTSNESIPNEENSMVESCKETTESENSVISVVENGKEIDLEKKDNIINDNLPEESEVSFVSDKSLSSSVLERESIPEQNGSSLEECTDNLAGDNKVDLFIEETSKELHSLIVDVDDGNDISNVKNEFILPVTISDSNCYAGWFTMNSPDYPSFLSSWSGGVVLCNPKFNVYYTIENSWRLLNYKAQFVMVSHSGNIGVRIHCSVAQYSDDWLNNQNWNTFCRDVQHAAVSDDKIWFISRGELFYFSVKEKLIHPIPCASNLSKIYCHNLDLYAVSVDGLVLRSVNYKWEIIKGIKNAKLLCIGPNNLIWVINSKNRLFVTDSIKDKKSVFWQVSITGYKCNEVIDVCTNGEKIFTVSTGNTSSILFNQTYVRGHIWTSASLNLECNQIAASGVFEDKGCIWIVETNNKLLALHNSLNILEEIDVPCNILCIASAHEALWILGDDSCVYLRLGIVHALSYDNPVGNKWRKLNTEQLYSHIELIHLSCGSDAIWACDIRGKIVMVIGSPHNIAEDTLVPAWVIVEGKPIENNTFTRVYVGPETYMVWALDSAGNIYVREGVFPFHPVGTSWVHVPEIKASLLTISSEAVYALNEDGIYKRVGINQSNYIGDAWIYFPVSSLDYISASFDGELWGISSRTKDVMKHKKKTFPLSSDIIVENDFALL